MKKRVSFLLLKGLLNKAIQIGSYIYYFVNAANLKKCKRYNNSFVRDFSASVLFDNKWYIDYVLIENHRKELEKDNTLINTNDLGAGSKIAHSHCKTIAKVAKRASVSMKSGRLLYRMARYYKPGLIIELGTSLGISTLYLSMGYPAAAVKTIEADSNLAALASGYFSNQGLTNIILINKSFDSALQMFPEAIKEKTIVFIDGNHQRQAVINYVSFFSQRLQPGSIIILDDINWSAGMQMAWKEIRDNKQYPLTIDLFYLGIVFFQENPKENYQIRF
jgi:predicted O-methyltransferase YrrM